MSRTLEQVAVLPPRTRSRLERYVPTWWRAVIAPDHGWHSSNDPSTLISQDDLDQLDAAAESIESRMDGSLAVPSSQDLQPLRDQAQEWINALNGDSGLPHQLRLNLLQDLEHLVWLIDHAGLFGVGRVTATSQAVVGNIVVATSAVTPTKRGAWLGRAKKFIHALVALSALLQGFDVGMELGADLPDVFGELTDRASDAD